MLAFKANDQTNDQRTKLVLNNLSFETKRFRDIGKMTYVAKEY